MKKFIMSIVSVFVLFLSFSQVAEPCSGNQALTITTGYNGGLLNNGAIDNNWKVIGDELGDYVPSKDLQAIVNPNGFGNLTADPDGDGNTQYNSGVAFVPEYGFREVVKFQTTFCLSDEASGMLLDINSFASAEAKIYLNGNEIAAHNNINADETDPLNITTSNQAHFIVGGLNTIMVEIYQVYNQNNPSSLYTLMLNADLTVTSGCVGVCSQITPCELTSFESDSTYWISGWVNVETSNQVFSYKKTVNPNMGAHIELDFVNSSTAPVVLYPTGEIIDGWQRIVGKFTVPNDATDVNLQLLADIDFATYFDDIRLHPFNASMKSYVYDGATYWLSAELDDNNYATFYEYDNEGGLIRIKKETARGIVTIQETRSGSTTE